jgi:hypothetical protein
MLLLQLDSHDLTVSPEGCRDLMEKLPLGETNAYFCHLDDTRAKMQKRYAKPFFKFFFRGKAYQVGKARLAELRQALQDGITGDSRFAMGFRFISASVDGPN